MKHSTCSIARKPNHLRVSISSTALCPQCSVCTFLDVQAKHSFVFSWPHVVRKPSSHQTFLMGHEVVYSFCKPQGRSCPCRMQVPHVLSCGPSKPCPGTWSNICYINRCFLLFLDNSVSYSLQVVSPSVNDFLFPFEHTVCSLHTGTISDAASSPGRSKAPSNHAPTVCWSSPPRQAGSAPGTKVQVADRT